MHSTNPLNRPKSRRKVPKLPDTRRHHVSVGILTCAVLSLLVGCQTGDATNKTLAESSPASAQSSAILKDVSNADFASLISSLENPVVLDVRTPEEWNEGHLEGATHADYWGDEKAFQQALDAIPRDQPVLVYCAGGGRSGLTAKELAAAGHLEVYNLEHGISSWEQEGFPVVTGPTKTF